MRFLPSSGFSIGFAGAFLCTWGLSVFMFSETLEFVAISVALAGVMAARSLWRASPTDSHDTMGAMVGGTAGGMIGGLLVLALMPSHCGGHDMTVMTDSMAGMVGTTLGGWGRYG